MHKEEGFKGQLAIVLPGYIQLELQGNSLTKLLYPTDIGYYPCARHHFRERPHGCDQHILIYCIDGRGCANINGIHQTVVRNQYFIIPPGMPHWYAADNTNPWTIHWLHYSGEMAQHFAPSLGSVISIQSPERTGSRDRTYLFGEVYDTLQMGYSMDNLEFASACLWKLLASFKYREHYQRNIEMAKHDMVKKSILFMQDHINESLVLKDIASHCDYSVSHFSLMFRKKTTRSPIGYFISLKMQRACQMLDFTEMHIKEIAAELDFEDQFYFSRLFRKVIGESPLAYRKREKG